MKYLDIKGTRVPALGFGTYALKGDECVRAVRQALDVGYRHIDTAASYDNESAVGQALAETDVDRDDIFVTTKIPYTELRSAAALRSAEDSLRRLGIDHVDLLLIHWPHADIPIAEPLDVLARLKADGRARSIGVSNYPSNLVRQSIDEHGAELLCDQVEYHVYLSQDRLLSYLRQQGMMLTAYCPLAQGKAHDDAVLEGIGRRYDKSASQVALRWFMEQDNVAAIPKAASQAHMRSNFDIFDFALSDDDLTAIARLSGNFRVVNPSWGPGWDQI